MQSYDQDVLFAELADVDEKRLLPRHRGARGDAWARLARALAGPWRPTAWVSVPVAARVGVAGAVCSRTPRSRATPRPDPGSSRG